MSMTEVYWTAANLKTLQTAMGQDLPKEASVDRVQPLARYVEAEGGAGETQVVGIDDEL